MIVVTGGAGFIGSALIWALNQAGHKQIVSVDQLEKGEKWRNLVKRDFAYNVTIDDFPKWLNDHGSKVTAVFHMGACSATTEQDADFLMSNNVHYTRMLWDFCTEKDIPLIYASSAATYGSLEENFCDEHSSIERLLPINKYGWSKQVFDRWAIAQSSSPKSWYGLKFFNVYGPQEYHKGGQASVVYHGFPQVKDNKSLKLFKSHREGIAHGMQKRDFVYIKDVVKVMIHLWQNHHKAESGIYNVGTGQARPFKDLGLSIFKALQVEDDFQWVDMPEQIRNQYQYFTEASLKKLREKAHYLDDFTKLEDGVNDYVTNYLNTDDPYL